MDDKRDAIINMTMFMDEIKMAEHNCDVHEDQEACSSLDRLMTAYNNARQRLTEVFR